MRTASIPTGGGSASAILSVLNPSFKGVADAKTLARYLLTALTVIKKQNLPVKIYVTQDITDKLGNILTALGVRFRTIPVDAMSPPYIFLYTENGDIVVKTVDADGKEVATFRAPFAKFVEYFEELFNAKKPKKPKKEKVQRVDEVYLPSETAETFIEHMKDEILEDT